MTSREWEMHLTRRALLGRSMALGATLTGAGTLLAGCGSSKSPGSSGDAKKGGTINYYSWQGYEFPFPEAQKFFREHDIKLKPSFISDGAETLTKFTTGGGKGQYNLSTFNAPYGPYFKKLDILQPLDMSKIPAYQDQFFPFFREGATADRYWRAGGEQLGIPFSWAYAATNYDASRVPAPKKATDLLDPPYKGKIALSNDSTGLIFQGALIAGIANEEGHFTPQQLEQIFDVLDEFKAASRKVGVAAGDVGNLFQNGEIVAAMTTWPGLSSIMKGAKAKDVKSVLPEEGALAYCDSYFIPAGAKDTDVVYQLLNEVCKPEMQAAIAKNVITGITSEEALPLLDPASRKLVPYDSLTSFFEKAPLFGLPLEPPKGITSLADWQKRWEQFLAD